MKKYYRVCNINTHQGLWYDYQGIFTGLIHDKFNFCLNAELKMDFDPELIGWLSATESLEHLYQWFPENDIIKLQEFGWFIHEFEANDIKFYERFQHNVIKQSTSKFIKIIKLQKMNTTLQETLIDLYNEFKAGISISELANLHQVTNTEMFNLVQIGKRLCNS